MECWNVLVQSGFYEVIKWFYTSCTLQARKRFPLWSGIIVSILVQIQSKVLGLELPKDAHCFIIKKCPFFSNFFLLEPRNQLSKCSRVLTWQDCLISVFWHQKQYSVMKVVQYENQGSPKITNISGGLG